MSVSYGSGKTINLAFDAALLRVTEEPGDARDNSHGSQRRYSDEPSSQDFGVRWNGSEIVVGTMLHRSNHNLFISQN